MWVFACTDACMRAGTLAAGTVVVSLALIVGLSVGALIVIVVFVFLLLSVRSRMASADTVVNNYKLQLVTD